MKLDRVLSPVSFMRELLGNQLPLLNVLRDYETWWEASGRAISTAVDRAGTPWVKMYDALGNRIDELMYPPDYRRMLMHGYTAGVVWRAFTDGLPAAFMLGYVTSYYDMGLYCPYTVSLATAVTVEKYAPDIVRSDFLHSLLLRDTAVWQGATWMTEAAGGSDLGATVSTRARQTDGDRWVLTGEKYFCSNVGAELAVVAARPEGAPAGVRGLALYLLPRYREDGSLNYTIRRMKDKIATRSVPTGEVDLNDSEAYLLGQADQGIYLILEVLNLSRVANVIGSVAVIQRALSDAYQFASQRRAFGKPLIDQPLIRRQFDERLDLTQRAFALAWETIQIFSTVWMERAGAYSDAFHLFRLMVHLAKYWTAEIAVQTAKWSMEVHGGIGTLAEYGIERQLREAMIADIWEGPPHRQMLDGLEVMERRGAHHMLLDHLAPYVDASSVQEMRARIDAHLELSQYDREAGIEPLFHDLARFAAAACERKLMARVQPTPTL